MTRTYLLPYSDIDGGVDSTAIAVMAAASSPTRLAARSPTRLAARSPTRVAGGSATLHGYVSITASKSLSEILSFSSAFFFSFAPVSAKSLINLRTFALSMNV